MQLQADVETSSPQTEVLTTFDEQDPGHVVFAESADGTVTAIDDTPDLQLGTFLERPVTIDTFTWSTADTVGVKRTFKPWTLLLDTATVKNKLNNYGFLRGKLHLKVMINATPFQYGFMRAAYIPISELLGAKIRTTTTNPPLLTPYSQTPGFYIEPQTNSGGELECPFLYHKNWLNITSASDVDNMGTLYFVIYSPLAVAIATAPTSITVKVVAWMTDVELMASTSKLALQGDEYGQGYISKPASAVADIAGTLTKIPIIGKFARATQIGAAAVSGIASLFGFTNPPNIKSVDPMYLMSAPQMATSEISVPYQKLALDPKTELTIDPRPFGLDGEDQLSMAFLKKRESYFGSATWNTSDVEGTQVFNATISPTVRQVAAITNTVPATVGYRHYNTPLSYLSCMFNNWRGSIKIRMKVVATKYHRGRLKVSWDPINDVSTIDPGLNVCYNQIVDITDNMDVTFEIPYHQALAWLSTDPSPSSSGWTAGSANAPNSAYHNGALSVRVYNTLEAPATSTVSILFYISGGDDFEFNNPKGGIQVGPTCPVPSLFALQGEASGSYHLLGPRSKFTSDRYHMNWGESVPSLRKLLHRCSVVDSVPLPNGTVSATNLYRKGIFRIPYCPGFTASAPTSANKVVAASGTANYAFNTMHPITWVAGMFVGIRGGVNYTVTTNSPKVTADDIRVTRVTDSNAITAVNRICQLSTSVAGTASFSDKCAKFGSIYGSRDGAAGMALTSCRIAPSVQFTIPDYNSYNFTIANPISYVEGSTADGTDAQGALVSIYVANTTATDELGYSTIVTSAGAGTDFTCVYFLCCPTVDNLIGDPSPV